MIKARHSRFAEFLYRFYISRKLRSNFREFILTNNPPVISKNSGLIVTPNHFSWWDGFFTDYLFRKITDRKRYILMLESQLKKYSFFRFLGAYSIRQESVSSVKESIEYSKQILKSEKNYLIFYPQGEIQQYESNNVKLKKGLSALIKNTECEIIIVSFKIVYGKHEKPSVYCRFGETLDSDSLISGFENYDNLFRKNIKLLDEECSLAGNADLFKENITQQFH